MSPLHMYHFENLRIHATRRNATRPGAFLQVRDTFILLENIGPAPTLRDGNATGALLQVKDIKDTFICFGNHRTHARAAGLQRDRGPFANQDTFILLENIGPAPALQDGNATGALLQVEDI
jgi:hypothetical protein